MTIDRNGNVGIGSTSPSERLDVVGKTKTEELQITTGATDGYILQGDAAGAIRFRTRNITRMTLDGDGKLGLGTKNPSANVHLYGNGTSGFTPGFGGTRPEIGFARGGFYSGLAASIQLIDYNGYSGGLCFNVHRGVNYGGGTFADNWPLDVIQAMTIENNGDVGIGTANPEANLEVAGDVRLTNLSGSGTRMVVADADGDLSTQAIPSGGVGGTIYYVERPATNTTSTTSSSYETINGMYATSAAGTYMVTFSGSGYGDTNGQDMHVALYIGSGKIGHTEREYGMDSGSHADDLRRAIHTQAVFTVNGSQQISTKWKESGGTFRMKD